MAWRFRLGSRRGESGGTGVQVAEDPREEPVSQNVATEDSAASASASQSITAGSLDLAAISEIPESPAVAAEAQKSESDKTTAELESDSTAVNILAAQGFARNAHGQPNR